MAKALLGHVGIGPDLRLAAEVRRLRARVAELESELAEAHAALVVHVDMQVGMQVDDDIRVLTEEPALT